jgi:hypothetical protein
MVKRDVTTNINKYILPNLNGYVVDSYLIFKYFAHQTFIKGYLFHSSGNTEVGLKVTYFVMPLFIKEECLAFTFGDDIFHKEVLGFIKTTKNYRWDCRKEHQINSFLSISNSILKYGEPILSKINSAKDFYDVHKKEMKDNIRVIESLTYSSIYFSDIKFQNNLLDKLKKEADSMTQFDWVKEIKNDAISMLSIENIETRKNVLTEWQNFTRNKLIKNFPKLI